MPKPKPTEEQERAKAVKYARWAVVAWPIGFIIYVGLLCLYFLKRYEPSSTFNDYDGVQMSIGLLLPAYGYADAKYTLRTNGKELGSPGYIVVFLFYNGVSFFRDAQKQGFHLHWKPWMVAAWLLLVVPVTIYAALRVWRIRAAKHDAESPAT